MKRLLPLLVVALLLLFAAPVASSPPTPLGETSSVGVAAKESQGVVTGQTGGGAYYRIVVPPNWNGTLVLWNHGFSLSPIDPVDENELGPLAALQLSQGYAVAASSYQQNGWALFKTKQDLQQLYAAFVRHFGHPEATIVTGASLGGAVTAQALEQAHLGNVVGAYTICGAVAGSRNWNAVVDLRLIYDLLAEGVPGGELPGDAGGLPPDSTLTQTDLALAVNAVTGILLPPAARTFEQQARLDTLLAVAQIPESFLLTDMAFATFGLGNLTYDQGKLHGKLGAGNIGVDYGDPQINAAIERVAPNPGAANRLANYFTPKGEVGDARIVAIHTDKDGLVIVENEHEWAEVVPADQLTVAVVVEAMPSHCGFTGAETVAGWEALRGWIATGIQPSAASIQALCQALEPVFGGPCRYDPGFLIPDMDGRIRPR